MLERATVAIEGIDATLQRQDASLNELFARMDERDARADERDALAAERHEALMREHRGLLDRFARSEDRVVDALGEMSVTIQRNVERLDDMRHEIKANTQAVLAVLDRLGPAPGTA
ncbi:MAG: hypothetical protein ACRDK9_09795 [Solirubrobacterales bacterium]